MNCILHIGLENTGTTSIQHTLAKNRFKLREEKILYPYSLGRKNHFKIALYAKNDGKYDHLMVSKGITNVEQLHAFRQQLLKSLQEELYQEDFETLLISNEHLSSKLLTSQELVRLKEFLSHFTSEIKIIVYLRDQSSFFLSSHSTAVKSAETMNCHLQSPVEQPERYDYFKLLTRWIDIFGKNNLIVRVFEKDQLIKEDD